MISIIRQIMFWSKISVPELNGAHFAKGSGTRYIQLFEKLKINTTLKRHPTKFCFIHLGDNWTGIAIFRKHLRKFVEIEEAEYAGYSNFLSFCQAKKENLLVEGGLSKFNLFVSSGCLRKFLSTQMEPNKRGNFR